MSAVQNTPPQKKKYIVYKNSPTVINQKGRRSGAQKCGGINKPQDNINRNAKLMLCKNKVKNGIYKKGDQRKMYGKQNTPPINNEQ